MTSHGALTARLAQGPSKDWKARGYRVLYDHGSSSNQNVGKIVSWFGESYCKDAELSQLDIAIVEEGTYKALALIEIEETTDRPKTILGDAFGTLMGDHVRFRGERDIAVDECTVLIVLGKGPVSHEQRNGHLRKKVLGAKSKLSTGNCVIGNVVIKSFLNEKELETLTRSAVRDALDGCSEGP